MRSFQQANPRAPWFSIWFNPRQAIGDIVATRPRRFVWWLAGLGAIAACIEQILVRFGFATPLLQDWRIWLGLIVGGAILGIISLYLSALVLSWAGRWLGGVTSSVQLRAALSWGGLPSMIGVVAVLLVLLGWKVPGAGGASVPQGLSISIWIILLASNFWGFVVLVAMLSRVQQLGFMRTLVAYALASIVILTPAILVRAFLFQPFSIPSNSMAPLLVPGDYVLTTKYDYGYSRYSLPLALPLFSGRVFERPVARGDVVVFRSPKDDSVDFVKRVLGLPGDRVQMKSGVLYINDIAVPRERLPDIAGGQFCGGEAGANVKRWRETLANGVSYETLDCVDEGSYDNTDVYTVPTGHFFALGDNRDNSTDSRILSVLGYVPFANIIGRVKVIYKSEGGGAIRFEK